MSREIKEIQLGIKGRSGIEEKIKEQPLKIGRRYKED